MPVAAIVLLCAAAGATAVPPSGGDGMAILRKTQAAYAALSSFEQHTSATEVAKLNGIPHVTGGRGEIRYQRPAGLYVETTDPRHGSFIAASDGKQLLVYHGKLNTYRRGPAPPNAMAYMQALQLEKVQAMPCSGFAFVCGVPAQTMASHVAIQGDGAVNGVPCFVLVGNLPANARSKAPAPHLTIWVDKKTYLVLKVELAETGIHGSVPVAKVIKGKQVRTQAPAVLDETITETVQDMKVNPPLTAADFTYRPPTSATEQKP